jgi:hypothetical protein
VTKYLDKTPVTVKLAQKLANVSAISATVAPNMLLVLEEVAGSSGGGCDNVTDRFVAGFAWLPTLATVGASGFDRVHRQDIAGWSFAFGKSNYMLVGPPGWVNGSAELLTPHPDYFTTLLWKQLVGRRVLVTGLTGDADSFFASAWCASARAPYGDGGSVVVAWTNSASTLTTVALPRALARAAATSFLLSGSPSPAGDAGDLVSDEVWLNGQQLVINDDGTLPAYPFDGATQPPAATVDVPPYSYGFLVFDTSAADVPACV